LTVGAFAVYPMTAQLMSTPTEPYSWGWPVAGLNPGQQAGLAVGQVEDLVLVDLALVQAFLDCLGGPQAELGVPQRAVGVGVPRVGEGREVPEHVQDVAAVAQGVDERRVFWLALSDIRLSLASCTNPWAFGLLTPVCPLTKPNSRSRAEPRKSSPPLNEASFSAGTYVARSSTAVSGWPGVGGQVHDRLAGVEALGDQHVHP
jgi:hypothetical protein